MKFSSLLLISLVLSWFVYSLVFTDEVESKSVMDKAVEIYGGVFSGKEKNKVTYVMNAVKVVQDGRKNRFLLDEVNASFFTENGLIKVKSHKAFLNQDSEIVKLLGKVHIVGVSGEIITTETMLYNKKTSSIIAPQFVNIVAPEYKAYGDRMVGKVNKRKYKLLGNTKIDIKGSAIKEN